MEWVDTKSGIFLLGPSTPPWLVGEWILSLTVYSLELLGPC